MALRSDEYGEGPKGPASTGEEAEMGFEAKTGRKSSAQSTMSGFAKTISCFFLIQPICHTFQGLELELKRSRSFCTMGFYQSDRYLIFGWSLSNVPKLETARHRDHLLALHHLWFGSCGLRAMSHRAKMRVKIELMPTSVGGLEVRSCNHRRCVEVLHSCLPLYVPGKQTVRTSLMNT